MLKRSWCAADTHSDEPCGLSGTGKVATAEQHRVHGHDIRKWLASASLPSCCRGDPNIYGGSVNGKKLCVELGKPRTLTASWSAVASFLKPEFIDICKPDRKAFKRVREKTTRCR